MIFSKRGLDIYIHQSPIDMRYGFHKLTGLVREKHGMAKILDGHIFLFLGHNRTRMKVLFFDGTGLCVLIKRIEQGKFMWISDVDFDQISFSEFEQILHGSILVKSKLGSMPKRIIIG